MKIMLKKLEGRAKEILFMIIIENQQSVMII